MNGEVQKVLFYSKERKYGSAVEMALNAANIPVSVYTQLIDGVDRSLPTFHRYLKLRKRMLGVDQLHYYDLYAPLVGSVNLQYTPEEAEKIVLTALAPLGPEYTSVVQRAFTSRWIDLLPAEGKRSGAYSDGGAYDVHPYMLINYNGSTPTSARWPTSWATRCRATSRTRRSPTRSRTIRSSSPKWRRPSMRTF